MLCPFQPFEWVQVDQPKPPAKWPPKAPEGIACAGDKCTLWDELSVTCSLSK